jgi:SAM-dependent methyltransferase
MAAAYGRRPRPAGRANPRRKQLPGDPCGPPVHLQSSKLLSLSEVLLAPPGAASVPPYDSGWLAGDGTRSPFLSYLTAETEDVHTSAAVEKLYEESNRVHFIDVWTRRAMLARLGWVSPQATVVDIGCSAGHLLEDLRRSASQATLIGVDLVANGLLSAHSAVPKALLLQADVCALPLADASVDAVVSASVLEHVPDDERALAEICRIMRPGARAVIVIPLGPGNYDYYDRLLGHARRYARGELAGKASRAGLRVVEEINLGALLYPAFWAVKQRNRRCYDHLRGEALEHRVASDVKSTGDMLFGRLACRMEETLLGRGVKLPFGIRGLTVLTRPGWELS